MDERTLKRIRRQIILDELLSRISLVAAFVSLVVAFINFLEIKG